jgi:hypothetical protein
MHRSAVADLRLRIASRRGENAGMSGDTPPIPKRWWWTKRLVPLFAAFWIATIAARIWWGRYAESQLQAVRDEIAARGEPLEWSDLAPPPVPDEQNAAVLYRKALQVPIEPSCACLERIAEALSEGGRRPLISVWDLVDRPELRRRFRGEIRALLDQSREAFSLVRRARSRPRCNWNIDFSTPGGCEGMVPLKSLRWLGRLLCLAAVTAHDAGDDAADLGYLRDVLAMAESMASMQTMLAYLVRLDIHERAYLTLERITPDLRVGSGGGAVAVDEVRSLIADLLDDCALREGLTQAVIGERSRTYDTLERMRKLDAALEEDFAPVRYPREVQWLLRFAAGPMLMLEEARVVRYCTRYVESSGQLSYPTAMEKAPAPQSPLGPNVLAQAIAATCTSSFEQLLAIGFRRMSQRRMAGVALAIRLYEIEQGRRPEELSELVPRYMRELPGDPFAADGRTFGYLPQAPQALLYSLGEKGRDDRETYLSGVTSCWDEKRVHFLDGERPSRPLHWSSTSGR